jgi:hypothetical protein
MLLEPRVACRASWKQVYGVYFGLVVSPEEEGRGQGTPRRFLDNLRSQNQRRVVLWVVDELGDGKFELERMSY